MINNNNILINLNNMLLLYMLLYMLLLFIIAVVVLIIISSFCLYNNRKSDNFSKINLINYYFKNSFVTTLISCPKSNQRVKKFINTHSNNNLPIPQINPALHGTNDFDYIQKKYPNINFNCKKFIERKGAYGLTASFLQFLEKNKNNNYTMWYEDDALPTINYNFKFEINKALQNLPKQGKDIYYFGYNNRCKSECHKDTKEWKSKNNFDSGSHAILFTKESINIIYNYMLKNIINLPIDDLLYFLNSKGYIYSWYLSGYKSNSDNMICGLFCQDKTFCNTRSSVIDTVK